MQDLLAVCDSKRDVLCRGFDVVYNNSQAFGQKWKAQSDQGRQVRTAEHFHVDKRYCYNCLSGIPILTLSKPLTLTVVKALTYADICPLSELGVPKWQSRIL